VLGKRQGYHSCASTSGELAHLVERSMWEYSRIRNNHALEMFTYWEFLRLGNIHALVKATVFVVHQLGKL